jgi:ABC-2 type transport system permease protein
MIRSIKYFGRGIIRCLAFATKEANEVTRQPLLVLSLLLGPTLILLLFGLGYRSNRPTVDTLLVVPPTPPDEYDVKAVEQVIASSFNLVGTVTNRDEALARLARHEVEAVVVLPESLEGMTARGERIPVQIYTNEINPFNEQWIQYLAYGQISAINDILLTNLAARNQAEISDARGFLADARAQVVALRGGVTAADEPGNLERLERVAGALAAAAALNPEVAPETRQDLSQLQADLAALRQARDNGTLDKEKERLDQTEARITRLDAAADQLNAIPPEVLVSPLESQYQNLNTYEITPVAFYAPAVLALLVQHIAVTLGALSLVRERLMGSLELLRVAPVSALQMLVGKYLGYALFIGVVVAGLTVLMVYGLGVPFRGDPSQFAISTVLLGLASLGIGLTISGISATDSQAVQLSMLTLLVSIFFSGFLMPLDSFWPGVRAISYTLPLTHGMQAFQEEMLLGYLAHPVALLWLAALAALAFLTAWYFSQRSFERA